MSLHGIGKRLFGLIWPAERQRRVAHGRLRGPVDHVIVLDGTMSSLKPGHETNAGLTYRLLSEVGAPVSVYYEAGVQWQDWRSTHHVLLGRGVNRQIKRAFGYLASRYRPGDRIFFFGYSRGAYAVRSLAGILDAVGLLRAQMATERNVEQAYRLYQQGAGSETLAAFRKAYCHAQVDVEMVGVWDTVKALGAPFLPRIFKDTHGFHNHQLGAAVRHGYQALALHETRVVFEPVLWECPKDWQGRVEQVWFPGTHGDVGGQVAGDTPARLLSNIPLVWMLEKAERCGLPLPENWRLRYAQDPLAKSVGTWAGWGKLFWVRARRRVGYGACESLHESVEARALAAGVAPSSPKISARARVAR
ncbi:DUF2235 domain-containing protein [uncultured Lentibacter sp.]|uniref:DUF2235 domain-containing protein n=1 Tax=uncultured Lentibacter sp. TaxID=1659309 RepID=UPI002617B27E|nr:DUF2235 domain-containing protein [uncultured Lentibacter sp.]